MATYLSKSILLLFILVVIVCGIYPLALWMVGQVFFPFQANGSLLYNNNQLVGSKLIAQPFTQDEYFQPRPSAASYDATASASSALAASNATLRSRVTKTLGPIVKYQNGQPVWPDIEKWFQQDKYKGEPHLVAIWASLHPKEAEAWVNNNQKLKAYIEEWNKTHHENKKAPSPIQLFFQQYSKAHPGQFPFASGQDIPSIFFAMWQEDHPEAELQAVPGDLVTTSGSGLDPHISMQNALFQLDRVVNKWAAKLHRDHNELTNEIKIILQEKTEAPIGGLIGDEFINVLEVNLALHNKYGP